MRYLLTLSLALLPMFAKADEIVLKNGKSIPFRIMKDAVDSVEVQTASNETITIQKKDIKEVRLVVPKAPLTGATFSGDGTAAADQPANILTLIDPKKNSTTGEWRFTGGALVGSGNGILEVPYIPPAAAYDVEIVLERKDGDGEVNIGLVAQGQPFAFVLDWSKGESNGISCIAGKRVYENETKVGGKQLLPKRPRTILCAVRADQVVVLMDGKEFVNWKGDVKQLSHPSRTGKEQNLFLSMQGSTVIVTKYVVTSRK